VAPVAVVLINPGRDTGPGLGSSGEVLNRSEFELQRRAPRLDDSIVEGRPDPSYRLLDPDPLARGPEAVRGVLAALDAFLCVKGFWPVPPSCDAVPVLGAVKPGRSPLASP
jgi:hypothetical protein